jgi:hypothetical protein
MLSLVLCGTLCISAVAAFNHSIHALVTLMQSYRKSSLYIQPEETRLFSSCSPIYPESKIQRCKNENIEVLLNVW